MTGSRHRATGSDRGDTLVELLLGVVIIAVTAVAMLGALVTAITASGEHRSLADLDTVVKSAAESAKYDIQLQPSGPWFTDCASVTADAYVEPGGTTHALFSSISLPAGYSVVVTGIQYWNSTTGKFEPSSVGSATCLATPADQSGYQLLTLVGRAPNGVSDRLSFGVRPAK